MFQVSVTGCIVIVAVTYFIMSACRLTKHLITSWTHQQVNGNTTAMLAHAAPCHHGLSVTCEASLAPCMYHRCWSGGNGTGVKLCLCCGCSCGHGSTTYGKYGHYCVWQHCCSEHFHAELLDIPQAASRQCTTSCLISSQVLVMQAKLRTHCVSNNIPSDWCSGTNCPTNHAGAPAARWHVPSCRQVLGPWLCA